MIRRRTGALQRGMTLIEVIVAMVIVSIAVTLVAIAFGGVTGARTRQAAGDLATAVRYTYNLAAINNKVYALYIDLDAGTYQAGPIDPGGECERLLLQMDGSDNDPMIVQYKDTGDDPDRIGEEEPSMFANIAKMAGDPDPKAPGWTASDDGSSSGKLLNMISSDARDLGRAEAVKAGVMTDTSTEAKGPKRHKTFRKNQLGKPRSLPRGVSFGGVVLREGQAPVIDGVVPILFYPHGFTQRALIYLDTGTEENGETFTVEIMSLQGTGRVHAREVRPDEFSEVKRD